MSQPTITVSVMAGRRTFGSTRKLASGRYQASYWHEGSRYIGPTTYSTKADANAHLSGVEDRIRRGEWINPEAGKVLFKDYAEEWRESQAQSAVNSCPGRNQPAPSRVPANRPPTTGLDSEIGCSGPGQISLDRWRRTAGIGTRDGRGRLHVGIDDLHERCGRSHYQRHPLSKY